MQNQPSYFDNNLSRQDCNSKIIFLGKKKKSESSTNECINYQYSRDRFISEKESEIKIISKIFKQKSLNSQEIDNLNEESYLDKIYFLNEDKLNESSNLTSKENKSDEARFKEKKIKFLVIKEEPKKTPGRKRKSKKNNMKHSKIAFDNLKSTIQVH